MKTINPSNIRLSWKLKSQKSLNSLILFLLFVLSLSVPAQSNNKKIELVSLRNNEAAVLDQNYRMMINNLNIPFNNQGNIAIVSGEPIGGYFGGHVFLFSGGFLMSGKYNDSIWANGVAGDLLVQDYTRKASKSNTY
ncbi:MAG: hypothetical protein MZV64_03290 [Ignavibacteriales bacterium]|nr:hypothetical protein [Ignavibacteriales bacterium]